DRVCDVGKSSRFENSCASPLIHSKNSLRESEIWIHPCLRIQKPGANQQRCSCRVLLTASQREAECKSMNCILHLKNIGMVGNGVSLRVVLTVAPDVRQMIRRGWIRA